MKNTNWRKYLFEFLSIFIGVTMAFALNKWNEERKDAKSEEKTLMEISNGLELDLNDLELNINGYESAFKACAYFRNLIENGSSNTDSFSYYFHYMLRDFITIQNKSGYESLKSQGLELIKNDSLRLEVISLYDFHYEIIQKLEEEYYEMQFYKNHFSTFSEVLAEYFIFDENGKLISINQPLELSKKEKNTLLISIAQIVKNRNYTRKYYQIVIQEVKDLIKQIDEELSP